MSKLRKNFREFSRSIEADCSSAKKKVPQWHGLKRLPRTG